MCECAFASVVSGPESGKSTSNIALRARTNKQTSEEETLAGTRKADTTLTQRERESKPSLLARAATASEKI